MKFRWSGEIKRLAAEVSIFFGVVLLVANAAMLGCTGGLRRDYNRVLANAAGAVLVQYPEVDEMTLLEGLQSEENQRAGELFLQRYGILEVWGGRTFAAMEHQLFRMLAAVNGGVLLVWAGTAGILAGYFKKRQQKIQSLSGYMEALEQGSYTLELEDNADDELSGLRNGIYKLTVLLREQAALAKKQKKALADSVADISHQLKTPLTSVMVLMDNLSQSEDMNPQTRKRFTEEAARQISGMSWLVVTMLKLSRLEAGVVELKREETDLEQLAEKAVQKLELEAELRQITLRIKADEKERIRVRADEKWTVEAVVNILKNALEHSEKGGLIELDCDGNDVYAQLKITDYGEGMSDEEQKRLFQRFYRGETTREDSVGIGLALSKEIIEKQEGYISVESRKGRGTTFFIRFLKISV